MSTSPRASSAPAPRPRSSCWSKVWNRLRLLPIAAALLGSVALDAVQPGRALDLAAMQRLVFPRGVAFSAKEGDLPHYKAFLDDNRRLGGLVFWTTDLEPLERGY